MQTATIDSLVLNELHAAAMNRMAGSSIPPMEAYKESISLLERRGFERKLLISLYLKIAHEYGISWKRPCY